MRKLRKRLHVQLDPLAWPHAGISPVNQAIIWLIGLSILIAILQSEPGIHLYAHGAIVAANAVLAVSFTIEYAGRIWAAGELQRYRGFAGRFRYLTRSVSLIDLVAIGAIWVDAVLGVPSSYGSLFRLFRILRIVSLGRNSRWAKALRLLGEAIASRKFELLLALAFALFVLLMASTLLYVVEHRINPEAFGSIPRAMWWAVATLTTVGYGDVIPATWIGKLMGGIVALCSIAIIAMPAGILAAAFSDAFQSIHSTVASGDSDDESAS